MKLKLIMICHYIKFPWDIIVADVNMYMSQLTDFSIIILLLEAATQQTIVYRDV
jgi:hypothetical protein